MDRTQSVPQGRAPRGQDGARTRPDAGGDTRPRAPWPGGRRRRGTRRWLRGPRSDGPLRRDPRRGVAGGVAAGLAARTGFGVPAVRFAFVITTLAGGFGLAAYVMAWLLIPAAGADGNIASKALADRRGIALAAGAGSLLAVVLLIASVIGNGYLRSLAWPLVLSVAGLVLIWRNAAADEQAALRHLARPLLGLATDVKRSWTAARLSVAGLLLAGGIVTLLYGRRNYAAARPLGGVVLVIAAIVIVLGPWWLRIARDLMVERQARIRAEERADMAARVHDSVLQTLALIQRRANEPQQVVQLARAQERELRSWLFQGRAPGSLDGQATSLAAGVRLIQQEVESQHGVTVEAVTVGDCGLDGDLAVLLAAAREATVNAAKWSGAPIVSLFAEVEPERVSVFVRDRGRGFDPDAVPADRKGLAESIHARMRRRGGSAAVRTAAGAGTEVCLTIPREAGERRLDGA